MKTSWCCMLVLGVLLSAVNGQSGDCNYDSLMQLQTLYTLFEKALLNDPVNLYVMRSAFFPTDYGEPIVVAVTYVINVTFSEGAMSNPCASLDSSGEVEEFFVDFVWTSSAVFTVLDPYTVELLQPALLYLLNPITSSYYGERQTDADLTLNVIDPPFIPNDQLALESLTELTTMLKTYTNRQGKLEEWFSEYPRGYSTEASGSVLTYAVFSLLTTMLLVVAVLALVRAMYTSKLFKNYLERALNGEKPQSALLASVYVATAVTNLLFIVSETVHVILWYKLPSGDSYEENSVGISYKEARITILIKFILFLICCALSVFSAIHLVLSYNHATKLPTLIKWIALVFSLGFVVYGFICCFRESIRQKVYKVIMASNFLMFFVVIAWSLISTVVLILANPLQTLAVTSFLVSLFFLASFSIAFAIGFPSASHKCINVSLTIVIGIIMVCMTYLYLEIIYAGLNTGGFLEIFITLGPTVLTAGAALISRRLLKKFVKSANDSEIGIEKQQNLDTAIELDSYHISERSDSPIPKQFLVKFTPSSDSAEKPKFTT